MAVVMIMEGEGVSLETYDEARCIVKWEVDVAPGYTPAVLA